MYLYKTGYGNLENSLRPFNPYTDTVCKPHIPAQQEYVGMQFDAMLLPGKKGGFTCRVPKIVPDYHAQPVREWDEFGDTYHWEYDTKVVSGKMCIISKESDVCCGKAVVEIVKVADTYVIGKATMVQYTLPSEEKLARYLNQEAKLHGCVMTIKTNGKHGSYVEVENRQRFVHVYLAENQMGEVFEIKDESFYKDEAQASEPMSVTDFIFKHHHGIALAELLQDVVVFDYQVRQSPKSMKLYSTLMDEACEWGVTTVREIANVEYVEVFSSGILYAVEKFSLEEFQKIIKEASDINTKANNAIASKIRGRKIPYKLEDGKICLN